jgi:hypothetical protein
VRSILSARQSASAIILADALFLDPVVRDLLRYAFIRNHEECARAKSCGGQL